MDYMQSLFNSFGLVVPSAISAVLLLILAYIVARISKRLVIKALMLIKVDKYTDKLGVADEKTGSSLEFIGKLVFIIVFLLFLPSVLDKLGMENVSAPITMLVSQFLNFIPNILAAAIILVVGMFVANIIRQLIAPVLKRLNVDKLQEKAGIASSESAAISSVISYVVYVIILIPIIIAALQALNISAISDPAIAMLGTIFAVLPNIFVAIAIIIIGAFIAKIVGKLLTEILSGVGADAFIKKITSSDDQKLSTFSLSKVIGEAAKYIIILLFVVEALNVINLEVLQSVGEAVIAYLPLVISAVIIMGIAVFFATWVESIIRKKYPNAKLTAVTVKSTIIAVAVFMTLIQLGVATSIVNAAFIIVLGAFAVAFAVAFGIGGRDFAANTLKKLERMTNE